MRIEARRLLPHLILAVGVLGATGISLLSSRSTAWALAGPLFLAATVVVSRAAENRAVSRSQSKGSALLLAGAVFLAGAVVAIADPSSVFLILPVLGAGAASTGARCTLAPETGRAGATDVSQ